MYKHVKNQSNNDYICDSLEDYMFRCQTYGVSRDEIPHIMEESCLCVKVMCFFSLLLNVE
jgi:hypothetical protein